VRRTPTAEEIATTFMENRRKHPIFSRLICRIPGWKWVGQQACQKGRFWHY
jgi:hypothetical protein